MATAAPSPKHGRAAFKRKQRIVHWGGFILVVGVLVALVWFRDQPIPAAFYPVVAPAAYCFVVFTAFTVFTDEPLAVPARLQLRLYAGAVLVGLAHWWVWRVFPGLLSNYWVGVFSFIVIAAALRAIAAQMTKRQHARRS